MRPSLAPDVKAIVVDRGIHLRSGGSHARDYICFRVDSSHLEQRDGEGFLLKSICYGNEIADLELIISQIEDGKRRILLRLWFLHDFAAEVLTIDGQMNFCSRGPFHYPHPIILSACMDVGRWDAISKTRAIAVVICAARTQIVPAHKIIISGLRVLISKVRRPITRPIRRCLPVGTARTTMWPRHDVYLAER